MPIGYRSTPDPATRFTPYDALMDRIGLHRKDNEH